MRILAELSLAVWLILLTVAVLVQLRQITLLTMRLTPRDANDRTYLTLRQPIPDIVRTMAPDLIGSEGYLLHLTPSCESCMALVDDIGEAGLGAPYVAIVSGPEDEAATIAARLPTASQVITGGAAETVKASLNLRRAPLAVRIENGRITGWSVVKTRRDFLRLKGPAHLTDPMAPQPVPPPDAVHSTHAKNATLPSR